MSSERLSGTVQMCTETEDLLGKWVKRTGKRDEIFLATKVCQSSFDGFN
jgi:aryl-alcohol dehydrogenase-like predicted oxidoreductase